MKFSENWLREWVNPEIDSEELQYQLTMLGLEVDGVEQTPLLENIVVARIAAIEPHPDADKLRVCSVDDGSDEGLSIVCGAPNAREGILVPLARVGAVLPGGMKIKPAKLRGVASHGMLCSARELGLSEDASGLMELAGDAPVGRSISDYLQLDDALIEIDLTPNRGDCLSIRGVARDIAARNRLSAQAPEISSVPSTIDDTFPVELVAGAGCARYCGRVIRNIDPNAETPLWMREKLRRCGLRPISPVVDITNYVMMELGQPMHGFDLDKLSGKIVVRDAKKGEQVKLLDDRDIDLDDDTLVITDDSGVIALAGLMGGDSTSVGDDTRNVFFEAAWFDPLKIAGKPRRYDAHTDSAHRFERTVDPLQQNIAIERATALLLEITGGEAGPLIDVIDESALYVPVSIDLPKERIQKLLGVDLSSDDIVDVLSHLGLKLTEQQGGWKVDVPSYRPDISIQEDLVEEIARVYGYDRLPRTHPGLLPLMKSRSETAVSLDTLKMALVERGYQEAVTYSFVDEALQKQVNPALDAIILANPISSDMAAMRTSLWPGLLGALQKNLNHKQNDVRLFETGLTFIEREGGLKQEGVFAGIVSGKRSGEHWGGDTGSLDFFDAKGDVEALFSIANAGEITFGSAAHPALHTGQSAQIICDGDAVGWLGKLHPTVQQSLSLTQPAYLFEVNQAALLQRNLSNFTEYSRFPSIRRDIAIVIDEDVTLNSVLACIYKHAPKYLKDVIVFDIYTGKGVTLGRKSLALGLILQELSRTLTDADVEKSVSKIIAMLERELGAILRE